MISGELDFTNQEIDRYSFQGKLGRGKNSAVWLAHDLSAKRQVAIKVLAETSEDSKTFQQTRLSFQRDLEALAALSQQWAVLTYYTSFTKFLRVLDDGGIETINPGQLGGEPRGFPVFFIVVEYADGGCLGQAYTSDMVKRDTGDKVYIDHFIDLCMALNAAHNEPIPIIHRDIKPQNLFWFKKKQGVRDRVKLGDFGIAKLLEDDHQEASHPRGANAYMSPEAFEGGERASSPQRDIYALGCTFYELLTGELALQLTRKELENVNGPQELRTLYHEKHKTAPRPDAMACAPVNAVSVGLNELLKAMMAVEPESRPDLKTIISKLEAEKEPPLNIEDRIQRIELRAEPVYRSTYEVNPAFRAQLGESIYFVFISLPARTERKYKMLFALLDAHFDDTYSVCEVFGRYDFLIRVWARAKENKVEKFCVQVIQSILDDNWRALHVMHCIEGDYLGVHNAILSREIDPIQARIKLHRAQQAADDKERGEIIKELVRQRIYLRPLERSAPGSRIKCFCLIKDRFSSSMGDRIAIKTLIQQELSRAMKDARKQCLSVYMKAFPPFGEFENESSDYIVTYVTKGFEEAISVPAIIVEKLQSHQIQTSTLLATKRFYVESDRMAT